MSFFFVVGLLTAIASGSDWFKRSADRSMNAADILAGDVAPTANSSKHSTSSQRTQRLGPSSTDSPNTKPKGMEMSPWISAEYKDGLSAMWCVTQTKASCCQSVKVTTHFGANDENPITLKGKWLSYNYAQCQNSTYGTQLFVTGGKGVSSTEPKPVQTGGYGWWTEMSRSGDGLLRFGFDNSFQPAEVRAKSPLVVNPNILQMGIEAAMYVKQGAAVESRCREVCGAYWAGKDMINGTASFEKEWTGLDLSYFFG